MDNITGPLVSIVFTSYNHKEYLKQALDSLVNQTYRPVELIIVDDCSTDGSQEILKQYEHLPYVKLHLQQENSGSYVRASNYGAQFATGEYLLFAQCDDFAEPAQLEKLVAAFDANPTAGVVFSRSNLVDENGVKFADDFAGRQEKFKRMAKNNTLIKGHEMKEFLSFSCVIPNLSAALIRRDLFESVGLSDQFRVVADWEFWLNLSEQTDFYYLTEPLNNFRQHATTIRSVVKVSTQIREIYLMFYNHIRKYTLTSREKQNMRVGAGAVWFAYMFENKSLWLKSFGSVHREISKIEQNSLTYLFLGIKKQVVEFFHRKKAAAATVK